MLWLDMLKPYTQQLPWLCTSCSTWALNHRDRNITAAYLGVSSGLFPSLHLHFVAPAKCCHPKSPTNLPPYGSKATAVAWWSSMAPSASAGHTLERKDGHSFTLSPQPSLFKSFALCVAASPPPPPNPRLHHQKKKEPPDNF